MSLSTAASNPAASTPREPVFAVTRRVALTRGRDTRWTLRVLLVAGAAFAVAAAAVTGDPAAYLRADPSLGALLRGMAGIKALMTAAAVAALFWRCSRPIAPPIAALYLGGAWCMAGASMLVWRLSHIGLGALVFHAGELTLLFVAWREHRSEAAGTGAG
jgi:hypothetical protein